MMNDAEEILEGFTERGNQFMIHRYREPFILSHIEADLQKYEATRDPEAVMWMVKEANKNKKLHYDLETIDQLLELFHHPRGAAIAIFDELFPLKGREAKRLAKARRRAMKNLGIFS